MHSPADTEKRSGSAAARVLLVATPGSLAILVGLFAWMASSDLNPADQGYPRALASLLVLVGLWNVVADLRERIANAEPDEEYGRLIAWRVAAFVALIAVCIWLVEPIGFYPAAGLMIIGGLWILGIRKPLPLIGYPLALIGLGYVLFSVVLGLPLPLAKGF